MRELRDVQTTREYRDHFLISATARCVRLKPPHVWDCDLVVLAYDPLEPEVEWESMHRETLQGYVSHESATEASLARGIEWVDAYLTT
jgi:hypothetical protein